jgi:tetratricopeptide (TPR) repeat protein
MKREVEMSVLARSWRGVSPLLRLLALVLLLSTLVVIPAGAAKKSYSYETDPIRLGNKALDEGRIDDAKKDFDEALTNEYETPKAHYGLAEVLRRQADYAEAEPLYRLALTEYQMEKGNNEFPEAYAGLGLVLLRLGKPDDAAAAFETALKIKGIWQAQYGMARVSIDRGEFDQALELLRKGEKKKGVADGEDLYDYGMGLALFGKGQVDEAEKMALKAFTLNPNDPEYGTLVAQIYTKKGDVSLAIGTFEQALAAPGFQPTAQVYHTLGALYQQEAETPQNRAERSRLYNEAINKYLESARLDTTYAPAWKDMAALYALDKSRGADAARAYLRYVDLKPKDPDGYLGLAEAALKINQSKTALEAAQKAYDLDSTKVETRLVLARAAFQEKDKPRAAALYASVTDTTLLQPDDLVDIGQLKMDGGELDAAEQVFHMAMERDSSSAEAPYWLGYTALKRDKTADAIGYFRKAVSLDPNNPGYYLNWGIALVREKKNGEACDVLHKVAVMVPNSAQVHVTYAGALAGADSLAACQREYEKALEIEPQNVGALRGLGYVHLVRKAYSQAVPVLKKATEVDPNNADGWYLYGQALTAQNQLTAAVDALKKALAINPNHAGAKQTMDAIQAEMQRRKAAGAPAAQPTGETR